MTVRRDEVTAVVLTGGSSRRMGRDKATLVPADGDPRTLARRVLDSLQPLAAHALVAGPDLPPDAPPHVAAVPDQNTYAGAGPVAGIAAALHEVRTPYVVVAACDMPSIRGALVRHLLDRAAASPGALCVFCTTAQGAEPLLSVWRPAAASPLDALLQRGIRALRDAVAALPSVAVEEREWRRHDPDGASFANWNAPEDLP